MNNIDEPNIQKLKNAADLLLIEARRCSISRPRMGVPAMVTAFTVVLAMGEILFQENSISSSTSSTSSQPRIPKPSDREYIEAFCSGGMTYEWLVDKNDIKQNPIDILTNVRNGLSHVLSLPNNVVLIPSKKNHSNYPKEAIGIVPRLFVKAIQKRSDEIFSQLNKPKIILSNPHNVDRSFIQTDMYEGTVPYNGGGGLK
jgi:hypothetical protein